MPIKDLATKGSLLEIPYKRSGVKEALDEDAYKEPNCGCLYKSMVTKCDKIRLVCKSIATMLSDVVTSPNHDGNLVDMV